MDFPLKQTDFPISRFEEPKLELSLSKSPFLERDLLIQEKSRITNSPSINGFPTSKAVSKHHSPEKIFVHFRSPHSIKNNGSLRCNNEPSFFCTPNPTTYEESKERIKLAFISLDILKHLLRDRADKYRPLPYVLVSILEP